MAQYTQEQDQEEQAIVDNIENYGYRVRTALNASKQQPCK
jgi:hypothetical protein